jgi:Trk K+ transport system NAD-binding subunit
MSEKIVVIGVNHAGTSAIRTLLSQNPYHEVTAFDRNDNISYTQIRSQIGGHLIQLPYFLFLSSRVSRPDSAGKNR